MSQQQIDVIAAGHLCLDMIPTFPAAAPAERIGDVLRPGTLVLTGPMTFGTGGSVSNVGIAMKIFGSRVGFVAKVGEDAIGRLIIDIVQRSGSAEGIRLAPGEASSYTVVISLPGIDRIFLHCPGTNDTFTVKDLDLQVVSSARLFHLGYPTLMRSLFVDNGAETARILEAVKAAGVTTSLDISLPDPNSDAGRADWRRIYESSLQHTDIFVPSLEETFFTLHPEEYLKRKSEAEGRELLDLVGPEECEGFADELLAMGCRIVVIKNGHNGWFVKTAGADVLAGIGRAVPEERAVTTGTDPAALPRQAWLNNWGGRRLWCPAFRIDEVASTAGAGDSSIAGFLTALLQGRGIENSLRLANAAGALNLRAVDTLSGLGTWSEVEEAARSLPVRELSFLRAPWAWREDIGMWERKD